MQGAWLLLLVVACGPRLDMQATDFVDSIEINTFGEQPRTALIYRDADGIRDWRWQTKANVAVCYTRTLQDVEVMERNLLPEHKRRKLAR